MDGTEQEVRINKYLSDAGVCSRREADRLIADGRVEVDGVAAVPGQKVSPTQYIEVDGRRVDPVGEEVLLVVNKPRGIVCTSDEREPDNIVNFVHYPVRVYPIGRLDRDSSGLILMTNQGWLVNRILRGGNNHEKEYQVRVSAPVTAAFLREMAEGVVLDDGVKTKPCRAEKTGTYSFRIILTQGLNRQIRRMCAQLGYRVVSLKRTRIMNIRLGDMKSGEIRPATEEEIRELKRLLADSSELPWTKSHADI